MCVRLATLRVGGCVCHVVKGGWQRRGTGGEREGRPAPTQQRRVPPAPPPIGLGGDGEKSERHCRLVFETHLPAIHAK